MQDASQIAIFLGLGALLGAAFVFFARWSARWPQLGARRVLAYALIATAALYIGFALRASDNLGAWIGIEMTGVAIYGSFALLSLVGSAWWLAIGWLVHPFWDIQFHYIGTGSEFTPEWYALACAGFDVAVAAYVAYGISSKSDPSLQRPVRASAPEPRLTRAERRAAASKKLR
jgi:hypothetical protein